MGLISRIKGYFTSGYWSPISGMPGYSNNGFGNTYDAWKSEPAPSVIELLNSYEEIVYSCVNLISNNVAEALGCPKLCVASDGHDLPNKTKALDLHSKREIQREHKQYCRKAKSVEEVLEHRLLDLLECPNPLQSLHELIRMTETMLELAGSAYWYLADDDYGRIRELWLLPTQNITPEKDEETGLIKGYWNGAGKERVFIEPERIINFSFSNPMDPYGGIGMPPVRAVWQRVQLMRKEQSSWEAILNNCAYPSAIIYPPDGDNFRSPQYAERFAKEMEARFRQGKQGGVWVVNENLKYQPVSTPPKDLSALQLYDQIVGAVCKAYSVPRPMLDMQDSNFASAETAERSFQLHCLAQRITLILTTLNKHLVSRYDKRLFLVCAEPIQIDKQFELNKTTAYVQCGIICINEERKLMGLESVPWGDKPLALQTTSSETIHTELPAGGQPANIGSHPIPAQQLPKPTATTDKPGTDDGVDVSDTALNGAQISSLLMVTDKIASGEYPPESGAAILRASFPSLSDDLIDHIVESLGRAKPPADATTDVKKKDDLDEDEEYTSNPSDPTPNAGIGLIASQLTRLFDDLRAFVLDRASDHFGSNKHVSNLSVKAFIDSDDWTTEMKERLTPILRVLYARASNEFRGTVGGDEEIPLLPIPKLNEAVSRLVLDLAQSTLASTSQDVEAAIAKTREALEAGLDVGEANNQLTARINAIFDSLSTEHSYLIADTESTRIKHDAELTTAKESGLDLVKVWLPDALACEKCRKLEGVKRGLDEPFIIDGTGPYSVIDHPPRHCNCRCTLVYEVKDDSDVS